MCSEHEKHTVLVSTLFYYSFSLLLDPCHFVPLETPLCFWLGVAGLREQGTKKDSEIVMSDLNLEE